MRPSPPAQALVIVPFRTPEEAHDWADRISSEFPAEMPLLVTAGTESIILDRFSGAAQHELMFAGGWRAKVADVHNGVVVIARPTVSDSELESLHP